TAHPDGCVLIYPEPDWEPVRARVATFPSFDPTASWWKRLLLGFEEHVSPDNSARILLPPALRMHAKLERDAMMVGQGHYFELWDAGVWSAKLERALAVRADRLYVDGTFGRGGHSRAILERLGPAGQLIALDRDPDAEQAARTITDRRFSFVRAAFSAIGDVLAGRKAHGMLFDLGVSSPQLE